MIKVWLMWFKHSSSIWSINFQGSKSWASQSQYSDWLKKTPVKNPSSPFRALRSNRRTGEGVRHSCTVCLSFWFAQAQLSHAPGRFQKLGWHLPPTADYGILTKSLCEVIPSYTLLPSCIGDEMRWAAWSGGVPQRNWTSIWGGLKAATPPKKNLKAAEAVRKPIIGKRMQQFTKRNDVECLQATPSPGVKTRSLSGRGVGEQLGLKKLPTLLRLRCIYVPDMQEAFAPLDRISGYLWRGLRGLSNQLRQQYLCHPFASFRHVQRLISSESKRS